MSICVIGGFSECPSHIAISSDNITQVLIELQSTAATFANNLTISTMCVMAALSTQ